MKAPLAGGTPTTMVSGQGFPLGISVDATSVYWTEHAWHCDEADAEVRTLHRAAVGDR